jgi:hypothetical protein
MKAAGFLSDSDVVWVVLHGVVRAQVGTASIDRSEASENESSRKMRVGC